MGGIKFQHSFIVKAFLFPFDDGMQLQAWITTLRQETTDGYQPGGEWDSEAIQVSLTDHELSSLLPTHIHS